MKKPAERAERRAAAKPARAGREARPGRIASKPLTGSEPRDSLLSGAQPASPPADGPPSR